MTTAKGTPDWVFAGKVPNAVRTALRKEMEAVRTWCSDQYDVEATDFTVLVGTTAEALTPVFRDVVGRDLLGGYVPPGYSGPTTQLPAPFLRLPMTAALSSYSFTGVVLSINLRMPLLMSIFTFYSTNYSH